MMSGELIELDFPLSPKLVAPHVCEKGPQLKLIQKWWRQTEPTSRTDRHMLSPLAASV